MKKTLYIIAIASLIIASCKKSHDSALDNTIYSGIKIPVNTLLNFDVAQYSGSGNYQISGYQYTGTVTYSSNSNYSVTVNGQTGTSDWEYYTNEVQVTNEVSGIPNGDTYRIEGKVTFDGTYYYIGTANSYFNWRVYQ